MRTTGRRGSTTWAISVVLVVLIIRVGTAEARTPERVWWTEQVVPMPVIVRVEQEWIRCAALSDWFQACYTWSGTGQYRIVLGSEGEQWLRHEFRHHWDYLDDGILNGSTCPRSGPHLRWSDRDWAEICAGPAVW